MTFMQFLKNNAYVREPSEYDRMRVVPYKEEIMIGLIVHSALSYRCHKDFFTTGEHIYYSWNEEIKAPDNPHDAMREHFIVQMFPRKPATTKIYEPIYGDLRIGIFDFSGLTGASYDAYIESIPVEIKESIECQERAQLPMRVARHESHIADFIQALEDRQYAMRLEQQLRQYGYRGKQQ